MSHPPRQLSGPGAAGPGRSATLVLLATLGGCAVDDGLTPQERARVEGVCAACHELPPPDTLPRASWEEWVPGMFDLPGPPGLRPPGAADLALARRYYAARAPASLAPIRPTARLSDRLAFVAESFNPRLLESEPIAATSNVAFVHLSNDRQADLVLTEMRSRTVLYQVPWAEGAARQVRVVAQEMDYPVHSHTVDMNRDGLQDIVIASIGDMNRDNRRLGSVSVLLQTAQGGMERRIVARDLARVADARAGDFDGDGDLDIAAAAFGWMGPGELLLLENRTTDWSAPRFAAHTLDERDGFISLAPADIDGDGRLDLVAVVAQQHEQVIAFLNRGGLDFRSRILYKAPHPAWGSSGVSAVDLDQDGDLDLLYSHGDSLDDSLLKPYQGVDWLENRGGLKFERHFLANLPGCESAAAADLDQDGDLDVVAASWLSQLSIDLWEKENLDSLIWIEQRPGAWQVHSIEKHRCYHPTVAVGDYNADGKPDIAVGNYAWVGPDGKPVFQVPAVTLFTAR